MFKQSEIQRQQKETEMNCFPVYMPEELSDIVFNYKHDLEYEIRVHNHKFHYKFMRTINQINDMFMIQLRNTKIVYPNKTSIRIPIVNPRNVEVVFIEIPGKIKYTSVEEHYENNIRRKRAPRRPRFDFFEN